MTLKVDAKFEENLTSGLENEIRNTRWDPFIQSIKLFSLKFTEQLFVMTRKNDAKFEEELI